MVAPSSTEVDLYMACVGNKRPPEPPVREAFMSLGVETIIPNKAGASASERLSSPIAINKSNSTINSPKSVIDVINANNGKKLKTLQNNTKRSDAAKCSLLCDALEFNERLNCSIGKRKPNLEDGRNELSTERKRRSRGDNGNSLETRDLETRSINTDSSPQSPEFLGYSQDDAAALVEEFSVSVIELFNDMSTLFRSTFDDMQGNEGAGPSTEQSTQQQMIRRLLCQNPEDLDERSGRIYLILKCSNAAEDSEEISLILDRYPHLAGAADKNKRLPLHVVASRTLQIPKASSIGEYTEPRTHRCILADAMNQHVLRLKGVLNVVYGSNPLAAASVDSSGSLPLHFLAKQFWQLELIWTEEMKRPIAETGRYPRRPYISNYPLFDEGTKMVVKLLKPIIDSQTRGLLRTAGPTGCLLPLHIAAIYGVPYQTMQLMLNRYPESACIPCKKALLGINGALALELFESRRNDKAIKKESKETQSTEKEDDAKESLLGTSFDRTSDLIFAYNPNVLPFRKNQERLKRIEHRIIQDAARKDAESITKPTKLLWIWLCSFQNEEDEDDHYEDNVEAILNELDVVATDKLLAVKGPQDKTLVDISTPHCIPLLRKAKREAMRREIDKNLNSGSNVVSIGTLCREVFGIKEDEIPTNFVILPYKVQLKDDNTVSLASRDDVDIAVDFAKALSEVNNVEGVTRAIAGMPAPAPKQDEYDALSSASSLGTWSEFHALLDTYETGLGYLYLLDEKSGTPMIPEQSKSGKAPSYPIVVEMSSTDVLHLLPLMQMGATLMRGKLGVSILAQMILEQAKNDSPPSFFKTVRDALNVLKNYESEEHIELGNQLKDLLIAHQLKEIDPLETEEVDASSVNNKWRMPIRILKEIIDLHDPKHTLAGLSKRQSREKSSFVWTSSSEPEYSEDDVLSNTPLHINNATGTQTGKGKVFNREQAAEDDVWSLADGVELDEKTSKEPKKIEKNAAFAVATAEVAKEVLKTENESTSPSVPKPAISSEIKSNSEDNGAKLPAATSSAKSTTSRVSGTKVSDANPSNGVSRRVSTPLSETKISTPENYSRSENESKIWRSSVAVHSNHSQSLEHTDETAKPFSTNERYSDVPPLFTKDAVTTGSTTDKLSFAQSAGKYETTRRGKVLVPQSTKYDNERESPTIERYVHTVETERRKSRQMSPMSLQFQEVLKEKDHPLPLGSKKGLSSGKRKANLRSSRAGQSSIESLRQIIQKAEEEEEELRQEVEELQATISSIDFRRRGRTSTKNANRRRSPVIRVNRRKSSRSKRLKSIAKKIYDLESEEQMLLAEKAALEARASSELKVREQKSIQAETDVTVSSKYARRAERDARYSKLQARIEAVESEFDATVSKKRARRSDRESRYSKLKARIDSLEKMLKEQQSLAAARNE